MPDNGTTSTAVATRRDAQIMGQKQAGDLGTLAAFLKERKGALAAVGASHMDPERVYRMVLACVTRTPALQRCKIESVFRASLQAVEMGLEPGSALGEAYLVPYGDQCQLIPGYRGLITLARRSGEIEAVYAHLVYEGDEFSVQLGSDPQIMHVPKFGPRDPKNILYAYAVARLRGGGTQFDVMTKAEVDAIRARSKAGGSGPWSTDYGEMSRKTVVRRLCKYLPMSVEMRKAVALDNAVDTGDWSAVEFDLPEANAPTEGEQEQTAHAEAATKPARGVDAVKEAVTATAASPSRATPRAAKPAEPQPEAATKLTPEAEFARVASDGGYANMSDPIARKRLARGLLEIPDQAHEFTDADWERAVTQVPPAAAKSDALFTEA